MNQVVKATAFIGRTYFGNQSRKAQTERCDLGENTFSELFPDHHKEATWTNPTLDKIRKVANEYLQVVKWV